MKLIFVWIFILYASIVACRDGGDVPMRTPDFQPPVVTGLYVTNDFVIVETWRNPSGGENIGTFPSITNIFTDIRFILPESAEGTVWITSAFIENSVLLTTYSSGQYAVIPGVSVRTFPKQNYLGSFLNHVQWDLKDDQGNKVKPGFYRVFVQTDDDFLFTDMFVYHDCSDIPLGIKTNICN